MNAPGEHDDVEHAEVDRLLYLRVAFHAAELAIRALPARAAFTAATELAELLRDLADRAAGLRARMAARVARDEGLSVRALARELGMAKSKAGELLARAAREDAPAPSERGEGGGGAR